MSAYLAPSDLQPVAGKVDPVSTAAGTVDLWIDISKYDAVQFIIDVGVISSGGTVDARIRQATDSSGTGSKDLATARAITQLTQAGTNSNSVVVLNVRGSEIDSNGGFKFVSPHVVVGTAAAVLGILALGTDPQASPPTSTAVQVLQ